LYFIHKSRDNCSLLVYIIIECGGQLRGPTGVISLSNTSSLFELWHSYQLRCTWNITVRPGRKILVKLITIKLSSDSPCVDDYILVCRPILWTGWFWDWIPNSSSTLFFLIPSCVNKYWLCLFSRHRTSKCDHST